MSAPQPPDGGQQEQPPQEPGAQEQAGDSTQVVNPAQAAQAAQQAQGQSAGDSTQVVSPMQQQPQQPGQQAPGGGDSTSVVPPSMQPPQPMYQQPGTQSQPGGFPAQPQQGGPGSQPGGFPAQQPGQPQQGFQQPGFQQGFGQQPGQPQQAYGQPQQAYGQPGFGQQPPFGQPAGAYGAGQPGGSSGTMLQIAMWVTIGITAVSALFSLINGIRTMATGFGAAIVGGIIGIFLGLAVAGVLAWCAWNAGQGKNWGRIVITVFGALGLLGGLGNLFVQPLVGIFGLLFGAALIVLWWLPDTSKAMQAKAALAGQGGASVPFGQPQPGQSPQQGGFPGQPQYGQPQYGQPQYGQPAQPQPGQQPPQQFGQPQPGYGQPQQPGHQQGGFGGQQPPQW